jgi:VWFA-related protein
MKFSRLLVHLIALTCIAGAPETIHAQQPTTQGEDVARVNTELVQTDVMVFSKDGSFIDGLKREQFQLLVDGKPHDISFFERIAAGSRNEEAQLAAARGAPTSRALTGPANGLSSGPVPLDRGRTVFFYLDDLHLSASSMYQARALLTRFIDHEMGQNDLAAITSATGQVGFLQQLTNDKVVLRAAVERLRPRLATVHDAEWPPMSEYQAVLVEQNNADVIGFFIDQLLKDNPGLPRQIAGDMVRTRASQALQQTASFTTASLSSLDGIVRSALPLPGRKILFLVSDGFYIDSNNSDARDRIRQITLAAARSGVMIYSVDARGLVVSPGDGEGLGRAAVDTTGRLQRASAGELSASQDGLNALAHDTGGRTVFNTNALSSAVTSALKETSVYYLVAWRPDNEEQRNERFKRVEVKIIDRPGLVVRLRHNMSNLAAIDSAVAAKSKAPKTIDDELREALRGLYPKAELPTSLALHFVNLPNIGTVLGASLHIKAGADAFTAVNGIQSAVIDIAGVVYDDQGRRSSSFRDQLNISATTPDVQVTPSDRFIYNYRASLKPGLYQVRVAARDQKTRRVGSAVEWIEMPDLATHQLALSSIIAGERVVSSKTQQTSAQVDDSLENETDPFGHVLLNVERRYSRTSRLRFLVFTYNGTNQDEPTATPPSLPSPPATTPAPETAKPSPDLAVQVQVLRDNEPVITTTLHKIQTAGIADMARVPYAADILLNNLPSGHYLLKVTVIDRIAKKSATQQLDFQVE